MKHRRPPDPNTPDPTKTIHNTAMHRDFPAWLETQTGVPTEFVPRVPLGQRRSLSREVLAETFLRFNVLLILAEDGRLKDRGAALGDTAGDALYDARDLLSENGAW